MEIERKYLIDEPPAGYLEWPFHQIEQAYLCTDPTVRIRREDDDYYMTYKSRGLLAREEYNLPLTKEAYAHLLAKTDGIVLTKKRYRKSLDEARAEDAGRAGASPESVSRNDGPEDRGISRNICRGLTIELDVFEGAYEGLILAEVEFPTKEAALAFVPPSWFGRDVTFSGEYQNSRLSRGEPVEF